MADFMSPAERSRHMAKIRSKDTKPELKVRRYLHAAGFRYRLHDPRLPGRPDLVFPSRRKVLFVNGCFWHGHDCPVGTRLPKTNTEFWAEKRNKNMARDAFQRKQLGELGWRVVTIWECQVKANDPKLLELVAFLNSA